MKKNIRHLCYLFLAVFVSAVVPASAAPADSPPTAQPKLSSRQVPTLTVGSLRFRDLNRNGQLDPYEDWRLTPEARAADLTSRMSLAEKAGTMLHGSIRWKGEAGTLPGIPGREKATIEGDILDLHITTMITREAFPKPEQWVQRQNHLQETAERGRLGIPLTLSVDPRHNIDHNREDWSKDGFSRWPSTLGFAAIGDTNLVRQFADIARREYRAAGIHMALSPMAELATEPRWGRIEGTFGEDVGLVRAMVRAYVEGFQGGSEGLTRDGVIAVVKHWGGYGAAIEKGFDGHYSHGRWSGFPGGSFDEHLSAFTGAFDVKVAGVMPTYTILRDLVHEGHEMEQVGGAFNKYLLTDLLRERYGFAGMILSDWCVTVDQNLRGTPWGMEDATPLERFVKGMQAGIDQFGGTEEPQYLIEAVELGLLKEAQLDAAVRRIVIDKFRIGLFENPFISLAEAEAALHNTESQAAALDAQRRSMVLLKNEHALLPLRAADAKVYLLGIKPEVAEAKGLQLVSDPAQANLVLARLKTPYDDYEGLPEGDLDFSPGQADYDKVVSLAANGLTVVASVYMPRPAVLTALLPHVRGLFGDFGVSDEALLDVLLGKAKPEGRLPFELPSSMEAVEAQKSDLPHDSENPLFPYGFGLSY